MLLSSFGYASLPFHAGSHALTAVFKATPHCLLHPNLPPSCFFFQMVKPNSLMSRYRVDKMSVPGIV